MRRTVATLFLCTVLFPFAGHAQEQRRAETPTVTITGEGSVRAVPDQASVVLGVVTEAAQAAAALEANSRETAELVAAVKAMGVAPADLATAAVSLEPRVVYPQDGQGTPKIVGYVARNSLAVTLRDLSRLGALLDTASAKGSNDIGGLAFEHSDRQAQTDRARAAAVADARRRAEVVTRAAGVRLGRVLSIVEGDEAVFVPQRRAMMAEAKTGVPIEAGTRKIGARVTISWEIAE